MDRWAGFLNSIYFFGHRLAEAALSYLPEGDSMEYAAAWPLQRIKLEFSYHATASTAAPPDICFQAWSIWEERYVVLEILLIVGKQVLII